MRIRTFDDARTAVAAGAPVADVARAFVAVLTREERLWCLDGDAPTWAGLRFLGHDGYHKAPFVAAQIERVGLPGIRFSDGPRGAVVRVDGPGRNLGSRAGGAGRRRHRPGAARRRRQPDRGGVRERASAPRVGPGTGDLWRRPASRRRARRRPDARSATPRDGLREAPGVQLDGERPLQRRHRGRRRCTPRSVSLTLSPRRG